MSDLIRPCVSVVMPTYNHAHYLHRAVSSVLNQTFSDFEIIIVDNHSTDNTDEVVDSFNDDRIALLKIHNHGVIAASRNAGIAVAKGIWVAFLDSDDWWCKEKLEACLQFGEKNYDLIYHRLEMVYDDSRFFRRKYAKSWRLNVPVLSNLLCQGNAIANSSVLVRKELLDQVGLISESREMITCEDYNYWLRVARLTDRFLFVPIALGFYLQHGLGASNRNMSIPSRVAVAEFMNSLNAEQQVKVESLFRYLSGRFNYLSGNFSGAIGDLRYALRHGDFDIRAKSAVMLAHMYCRR